VNVAKSPGDVLKLMKEQKIKAVDLRFMDFPGMQQHFTVPAHVIEADVFKDGLGFDGSSIRGWQAINESDMLVIPDPATAFVDPFTKDPTLVMVCNIQDPVSRADYTRDPRNIAKKALKYVQSLGIADMAYFGPEAEFFIFDSLRYDQRQNEGYYHIDSVEGIWNSGRKHDTATGEPAANLGSKLRYKEGYFPIPPSDTLQDMRTEMMLLMEQCGIEIEAQHHEVATGGQCEIDMKFSPLVEMADKLTLYKYIIKMVARRHGKTACFMPKPLFQDNGSGMHTHFSLWKGDKPLFAGKGYAGLSDLALHAAAGILKHAAAILAFAAPTTNSYKRLVPGYEAPVNLAYSQRNRSAAIRIPMYSPSPKAKRLEFRCPDPSCNPYLTFAAMLMAGIDGIQNKLDPGKPLDVNIYDMEPDDAAEVPQTPGALAESLAALKKDRSFLLKGDVFTSDVVDTWIEYKTANEVDALRLRPHPYEFMLYADI
jgi:glutamine synthetase